MGLSSSTNFSRAAALAIPHAGVGLSSIGEDDLPDPSWLGPLMLMDMESRDRDGWAWDVEVELNWGARTGEIMMKSSSCRGEGEGESLCLPLDEGNGDRKEFAGKANGLGDWG